MRVGSVGYATSQGLGHLMKWFYDAGVVNEVMIFAHPGGRHTHTEWYPEGTPVLHRRTFIGDDVSAFLAKIDVLLCYETPFDWGFVKRCRSLGIKTALVTMYEWYPLRPPTTFDLFLCPSRLDYDIFSGVYENAVYLPIPAPPVKWYQRTTARRYLHNAGHVGSRNHKGTEEVLKAMEHVKTDLTLTVRCQEERLLDAFLRSMPHLENDRRINFTAADVPYKFLFTGNDVYVAPEKYNGLSLPLQEAFTSGMAVMTTNRYPANTWLPRQLMVPCKELRPAQVAQGYITIEEAVVDPRQLAVLMDAWYGNDISEFSIMGRQWAEENSWEKLKPQYLAALGNLL